MQWKIEVDKEKCTGCGECVENCPGEVFELKDKKAHPVHMEECHACHTCESVCEEDAVQVNEAD